MTPTLTHPPLASQSLAVDIGSEKWDSTKREASLVSFLYRGHADERVRKWGERIESCAQLLRFDWTKTREGWRRKLVSARLCRVRTCPICRWRRSLQLQQKLLRQVSSLTERDGLRPVLLTLTIKNPRLDNLKASLKEITKAWSKLTRRVVFSGVAGWVRSIEITKGNVLGCAHPHLHALLLVDQSLVGLDLAIWSQEWRDLLSLDYDPQCDIRPITSEGGVIETLKYAVKPGDGSLDPVWLPAVALAINRVRLYACGGVISVPEPVTEAEYLESEAGQECEPPVIVGHPHLRHGVSILYAWQQSRQKYIRASAVVYRRE